MAFDPDEYLRSARPAPATPPTKFDPDAYLSAKPTAFDPDAYLKQTAPTPAAPPTTGPNPFIAEGAPAEAPAEKSTLPEFPKALVRGAYDLKGMYAGLQQRSAALGMETPQAAMDVFNKIDAGEIKSKADISKLIGDDRRLPTAEEMVQGDSRLGAKVRTFNLARDYLAATPEERKTLRAQMQSDIQQGGKDLASALALGEKVKKEAAPYEARVKSLFDIESFADAMSYLGSTSGQAIPQVVPMVGASVLTKGRAAAPAAVGAGMELGAGTQNRVDFISDKIKGETDPNKRIDKIGKYIQDTSDVTVTAAIMNGALDAILGPEKDIAKALAAQSLKDMTRKEIAKQIPKAVAKSGASEFFTGGMQEVVQINAERTLGEQTGNAFTKDNIKRVVDSAMAEAIGGATVTTGFETGRAAFAKSGKAAQTAEDRLIADLDAQALSEETTDDFIAAQRAGAGAEPGIDVTGVPRTGVAETTGVSDTEGVGAPSTGGLAGAGAAATVAGKGAGFELGSLEETQERLNILTRQRDRLEAAIEDTQYEGDYAGMQELQQQVNEFDAQIAALQQQLRTGRIEPTLTAEKSYIDLKYEYISLYDEYKNVESQYDEVDAQVTKLFGDTYRLGETFAAANEKQKKLNAIENLDPNTKSLLGEEGIARLREENQLSNAEARLLAEETRPLVDSYFALKDQLAALDAKMEPIGQQIDELDAADEAAREAAQPKAEEVIKEEVKGTREQRNVATYLEGLPQDTKRYNTYINDKEVGPLLQSANDAIQRLTDFINGRGFSVREVNRATADKEVQRAKDLSSEVSGIASRLLVKQDGVDRNLKRANPEQLAKSRAELEAFINNEVNAFLSSAPTGAAPTGGNILKSISTGTNTQPSPYTGVLPVNKFGINRLNKLFNDGKITAQEYAERMTQLFEEIEDKAAMKAMTSGFSRQRGLGAVIKALEEAAKKGRISEETAEFAKWLLLKNPAIAKDLSISISMPKSARARGEFEGVAGFYNDMARMVRILTKKVTDKKYAPTDPLVGVHEILHHMERMLPNDLRGLIRNEWKVQLQRAMDKAVKDKNQNLVRYFALVLHGNTAQSAGAQAAAENMIKNGDVAGAYYSFMNPSEFWAVNGADLLYGRYGARSKFDKLRQYLKEFIEAIKDIFGLPSNDPIIKGLDAVLKGDASFQQKLMLNEGVNIILPSIEGRPEPTAEQEAKLQEQFDRVGDLRPDVVEAIRNNDLNGALNILAGRLGGFYGELATKLASLNLQTSIAFDNATELTYRAVEQVAGPQLQRVMNYMRVADPDFYDNWFKDFDRPENLARVRTGIGTLYFDTIMAKGKGKHSYPEIANEIKDVSDTIFKYDTRGAPGAYYNIFDAITLDTKLMEGIGNRVFLHEVVHAATVSLLRANPSQLTPEQLEARNDLEVAYRYAQKNIKVNEYGLTNIYEFVAELFTNDKFRKTLKQIPYTPARTNILSRFFNAILRLVGADNLASRAMVEAEKLFTATRYQETKSIGPLFAQGKKPRIRGPISKPDTWRTAEQVSTSLIELVDDALKGRKSWDEVLKNVGPAMWDTGTGAFRKALLGMANLRQIGDLTATKFPQIQGAIRMIEKMLAHRGKKLNQASEIVKAWTAAQAKNPKQSDLVGRVMLEATIRGQTPSTLPTTDALRRAWDGLNPEFKKIYEDVRKFYADSVNEMIREMKQRALGLPKAERQAMIRKINEQFGPDKLKQPYFPLRRFGTYWFQVGVGQNKEFYEFESRFAREIAMRNREQQLRRGNKQQQALADTIAKGNGISELYNRNVGTTQVLKDVQDIIDGVGAADVDTLKTELKDSLNQLIYLLLPQQSMRKMFINRKAIQGASGDMLRVFATTAVHSAYQQSRFKYAEPFLNNLNNARDYVRQLPVDADTKAVYDDYVKEVEARAKTILSNEDTSMMAKVAGKASEATFYFMLSAPFTAILNILGFAQITMPYLGGRYGYAKTNAVILKNFGRYSMSTPSRTINPLRQGRYMEISFPSIAEGGGLSPLMQRAADRFIEEGQINISLTNDIFDIGERPSDLYTGKYNAVKKVMSGLFHQSERLNREVTLLTVFELAYDKFRTEPKKDLRGVVARDDAGNPIKNTDEEAFELAIAEAKDIAGLSLGDFTRQMKPRYFTSPVMSVLTKFKQYPVMATYAVARNFYLGFVAPFSTKEIEDFRKQLEADKLPPEVIEQRIAEAETQRKQISKEGRRRLAGILGMTFLLGGVEAQPFFSMLVGPIVKMLSDDDDDDEFFNWENWFKNYMEEELGGYAGAMFEQLGITEEKAKKLGRKTGEAVGRGVVPAVTGGSLADRVSLDPKNLWYREGRYSPDIRESVIENIIANAGPVVGLGFNWLDAYRLMQEGQYQRAFEKAAPAIVSKPVSAARLSEEGAKTQSGIKLADNFTATEVAMQAVGLQPERLAQAQKAAIEAKEKERKILDRRNTIMNRLWMERDNPEGFDMALEEAVKFSQRYPANPIDYDAIKDSFKKRAESAAEAEAFGAQITKKLRPEIEPMLRYGRE